MKKTAKEILERLEEFFNGNVGAYAYGDYTKADLFDYKLHKDLSWEEKEVECLKQLGLGSIEEVEQYGGEGQGDTWYSIKHFKDHGVYIKTDGFYSSYNGTDFDYGFGSEVKPVQKTVTVFE
jgi:hypothetical protein